MSENEIGIICKNVWKVFGANPESAIDLVKNGSSKQEVLEQTGNVIAVKDVSFEVYKNEIFVVMGLSGSGKSTLVRCINRLIEPTTGTIVIDGVDIAQMDDAELRELRRHKLSMVFQNFGLLPHRDVQDNVTFGLEIRGEHGKARQAKVMEALELVGLKGWEKSRMHELSGGMQQRVGLARALASDSEIILMDEPFSALDPLIRRQMQDEFIDLRTRMKKTVVFITHDLLEALKLGDRIAIMKDGEIVQLGTAQEIVSMPEDDYVSEFVKDVPRGQVIPVSSIMEDAPVVVHINQKLEEVVQEMTDKRVTVAFIVDGYGKLRGVTTIEKAMALARTGAARAKDVVQEDFTSTSADTPAEQILPLVAEGNIPVAVLDDRKRLLGVVSRSALIEAIQVDIDTENNNNGSDTAK
ncbi:glycine betaine/L-proline ABC transporter ATP-binding protein [Chloroflexota bacterium]